MQEKQTHLTIVRDDNGKIEKITIRGNAEIHSHCNAVHESNIGEHIFWHTSSHYSWPKVAGIVVAKTSLIWDYSLPIGKRATEVIIYPTPVPSIKITCPVS